MTQPGFGKSEVRKKILNKALWKKLANQNVALQQIIKYKYEIMRQGILICGYVSTKLFVT